jgi:hypothetical protein
MVSGFSCISQVKSVRDPFKKITRHELDAEVKSFTAEAEARYIELDEKDAMKRAVLDQLVIVSNQGSLNYGGLIAGLFSVLGVGAIADNVKQRSKIKSLSKENQSQSLIASAASTSEKASPS